MPRKAILIEQVTLPHSREFRLRFAVFSPSVNQPPLLRMFFDIFCLFPVDFFQFGFEFGEFGWI